MGAPPLSPAALATFWVTLPAVGGRSAGTALSRGWHASPLSRCRKTNWEFEYYSVLFFRLRAEGARRDGLDFRRGMLDICERSAKALIRSRSSSFTACAVFSS